MSLREVAAAYSLTAQDLESQGGQATGAAQDVQQAWGGDAADRFQGSVMGPVFLFREAAQRYRKAAAILERLDDAVAGAIRLRDEGLEVDRQERLAQPFAPDPADRGRPWSVPSLSPQGLFRIGQAMVAQADGQLERAYDEARRELDVLTASAPVQERAMAEHWEAILRKNGAPAKLTFSNGEVTHVEPLWDDEPGRFDAVGHWKDRDKKVEVLQTIPGGGRYLEAEHERLTSGWNLINPIASAQNGWLHAAEGNPIRAAFEFVNVALSVPTPAMAGKLPARAAATRAAAVATERTAAAAAAKLVPVKLAGAATRTTPDLTRVVRIGGQRPMNFGYAGRRFAGERWTAELARRYPDGVSFTPQGFPNFSPYAKARLAVPHLTGNKTDIALANRALGIPDTPTGWVWHHVEDGRTMELIPLDLHVAVRHTGGATLLRRNAEIPTPFGQTVAPHRRPNAP